MPHKRGDKAGTVYESPKGSGRWWAQLPKGPDGRRPKQMADSKEAAEKLLRHLHAEREAGRDLSRKAGTVAELADSFLATIEAHRRGSTARAYRTALGHVTSRIGAMKIEDVDEETVQALADKLAKATGPHQARKALTLLKRAYKRVVPRRVARNPVNFDLLTLRRAVSRERQPAEEAAVATLLELAGDVERRSWRARFAMAWWLAALLGLRRGELAGLTWADVSWERAELNVRTQVAAGEDGKLATGQPTKTPAGVRLLPVGPRLLARLRQHWTAQQQEKLRGGKGWNAGGCVLCREDGAPITELTTLSYDLETLCRLAGVARCTPHQLRHTFATLVADEGFNESVVAALLGHERRGSITSRYVHAKPKTMRAAVEAVEDRILGLASEAARGAR